VLRFRLWAINQLKQTLQTFPLIALPCFWFRQSLNWKPLLSKIFSQRELIKIWTGQLKSLLKISDCCPDRLKGMFCRLLRRCPEWKVWTKTFQTLTFVGELTMKTCYFGTI